MEALENWSASKNGQRKGRKVGFPRFKSARRGDQGRVRFTTGTMRLEEDRRTITLPVIGALRSKENTRRAQRFLPRGDARILNMTVSERWGRLFVSVNYAVRTPGRRPVTRPDVRAGVDLGLRCSVSRVTRTHSAATVAGAPILYFSGLLGHNVLLTCGRFVPAVWHSWHVVLPGPPPPWSCRRHASAGLGE